MSESWINQIKINFHVWKHKNYWGAWPVSSYKAKVSANYAINMAISETNIINEQQGEQFEVFSTKI